MEVRKKILYVDDEEVNLTLFELSLRKYFHVFTASSALKGLEILEKNPEMEVVISDLKMPIMNGLDFISRIKEKYGNIICILLTGFVESDVLMEGFNRDHIFKYMVKPWRKEQLIATIEDAFKAVSG